MALSYALYTGNGSTKNFAIPFPYIALADIAVLVNNTSVPYTRINDGLVQTQVAPAVGTEVRVKRTTKGDAPLVDFTDASTLGEADLDLMGRQLLYLAQEALDGVHDSLGPDETTLQMNARGRRIVNVGDPIDPQDAVTLAYLRSVNSGAAADAARIAAEAARDVALSVASQLSVRGPRVNPHTKFSFLKGKILSVYGSGTARHTFNLYEWFTKDYSAFTSFSTDNRRADKFSIFVSWKNGSDSATGTRTDPVQTVKHALTIANGNIFILPGDSKEVLNLRASDRKVAGVARPFMIRAYDGPGTVRFIFNDLTAQEIVWELTPGTDATWRSKAGTVPTHTVQALFRKFASTGPESIDGWEYEPIQHVLDLASTSLQMSWWQDPSTKVVYLNYGGMSIEANKANFEVIYASGATDTDAEGTMFGTTLYWEGVSFVGCKMPYIVWDPDNTTLRPVNFMYRCSMLFGSSANFHAEGAITHSQECTSAHCLNSDGFNYYERGIDGFPGLGVEFQFAEIDCRSFNNGLFNQKSPYNFRGEYSAGSTYAFNDAVTLNGIFYLCIGTALGLNPPDNPGYWQAGGGMSANGLGASNRNCQGSSCHGAGVGVHINGKYFGNFGQNIAHVVNANNVGPYILLIGTRGLSPYSGDVGGHVDAYQNLWFEGPTWADNVEASGIASYGIYIAAGATLNIFQSFFDGIEGAIEAGGTVGTYNPLI